MKRCFWSCQGTLSPQSRGGSQKERKIPQTENSKAGGRGWGLRWLYTGSLRECGRSQRCQRAGQSGTAERAGAALGLKATPHAVCEGGRGRGHLAPPPSSRSPHKRWPSCPQSPSRCTCRPWRCRSSAPTRTPWTGGEEEESCRLDSSRPRLQTQARQAAEWGGLLGQPTHWLQTALVDLRTWNMLAPYGVLHAFRRLSFPVLTNHLPANEIRLHFEQVLEGSQQRKRDCLSRREHARHSAVKEGRPNGSGAPQLWAYRSRRI